MGRQRGKWVRRKGVEGGVEGGMVQEGDDGDS